MKWKPLSTLGLHTNLLTDWSIFPHNALESHLKLDNGIQVWTDKNLSIHFKPYSLLTIFRTRWSIILACCLGHRPRYEPADEPDRVPRPCRSYFVFWSSLKKIISWYELYGEVTPRCICFTKSKKYSACFFFFFVPPKLNRNTRTFYTRNTKYCYVIFFCKKHYLEEKKRV